MPWFRFIDDARVTLRFRNGVCKLCFANLGAVDGWAWVAEKIDSLDQIVLVRRGNVLSLQSALVTDGFEVSGGSAADRIMIAAVRCGYAEELPDEERWRKELIRAKRTPRSKQWGPPSL